MKTEITREIEDKLKTKAIRESKRYAFEVRVPNGICDFVTTKIDPTNHNLLWVTCYEIKVSLNDFQYSKNGANFVGDENYYVMPEDLLNKIIQKGLQSKLQDVGLYTLKDGKFYKKTDGKAFRCKLSFEDKLSLMDTMIMKALYGV